MKTLIGWITDPYVHVLLIGLILVRLAMGSGREEPMVSNPSAVYCERCMDYHDGWNGHCNLDALADMIQGR